MQVVHFLRGEETMKYTQTESINNRSEDEEKTNRCSHDQLYMDKLYGKLIGPSN